METTFGGHRPLEVNPLSKPLGSTLYTPLVTVVNTIYEGNLVQTIKVGTQVVGTDFYHGTNLR